MTNMKIKQQLAKVQTIEANDTDLVRLISMDN